MAVHLITGNPIKVRAVETIVREFELSGPVVAEDHDLGFPPQPINEQIEAGAILRAQAAWQRCEHAEDLGIGIEGGLLHLSSDHWLSIQACAVAGSGNRIAVGFGPGYVLPPDLVESVLAGTTLREAFETRLGVEDPMRRGAVYYLSNGHIDREVLTREAVRMALVSWRILGETGSPHRSPHEKDSPSP